ncbi:MAG: hypothetical protein AAF299_17680 [Pseudomonadota bacterium]
MAKIEIAAIVFVFGSIVAHIYRLHDQLPMWANVVWGIAFLATFLVFLWKNFKPAKKDS